jgi:hypothetical protein
MTDRSHAPLGHVLGHRTGTSLCWARAQSVQVNTVHIPAAESSGAVPLRATYPSRLGVSTDGGRLGRAAGTASAVSNLWAGAWSQLRSAYPNVEDCLAKLETTRPTRFRALQRLESSAGRWAGRVQRGEAPPARLLEKLLVWQTALAAELAVAQTTISAPQPTTALSFAGRASHGRVFSPLGAGNHSRTKGSSS